MIQDQEITKAVSAILQRSERQEDLSKLVYTFVDVGILPQLENRNNQIVYGRRGTGKTHVLRVLGSRLREHQKTCILYIDARTLGSTAQFSDITVPLPKRCLALFRDVLNEIHNALLEHIVEHPTAGTDRALDALALLAQSASEELPSAVPTTMTASSEAAKSAGTDVGARVGTKGVELKATDAQTVKSKTSTVTEFKVERADRVFFPDLHACLGDVLGLSETTLFVLFDEWSSLPVDVQPYLAEFLKRGVLPIATAVLKIASLEYRSRFSTYDNERLIGFELGADIATATDLDDYYVFDRNPSTITSAYADMLFKHLAAELPKDYLDTHFGIKNGSDLVYRLFTGAETFRELARASEGVVRDLINIFTQAYFTAHRRGRDNIDRKAIFEAARQWFEQDKSQHLTDELETVLKRIVNDVIGTRKARSFLLPRELERHAIVQRLFDARVLHHMQRGYADKDNPGTRYNIYTLDYGTYVDLLGTSREPAVDLFTAATPQLDVAEFVVPFDDKRSIRRIVLTEEALRS